MKNTINNIWHLMKLSVFIFPLSTFVSCDQEDFLSQETDADAVKVVASISNLQTRVAYEDDGATNFINGDEICVQNILRETKNIATYTFDGTTWTTTDALVWNGGTAESQFQAWYPATASFDKFTLPTDQNSIEELPAADWMTASTSAMVKPDDKTINLAFEHKLAKVTVQITEFTSQFGDDPRLMAATIYSLSDEYVTVNGGIKPVLGGNAATAIVCPGKYTAGTYLMGVTISDDGHQTNLNVPVNAFLTDTGLEAGKHYKFSLKVGKDAISITKVNVEPWTTKEIDGGMAEEVFPSIDGTDYASLSALQNAVKEKFSDEDVTSVTLDGNVTDEVHAAVMSAISEVKTEGAVVNGNLVAGSVTYTVNAFSDALTAWTEGTTLTILGDATYDDGELAIEDKAVILDLNGHTLTLTQTSIDVAANAELTIRDSGENGQISSYYRSVSNQGTLYLEGGTLNQYLESRGILYMTGGKVFGRNDINAIITAVDNFGTAYISGGTLQGQYALYNNPEGTTYISGNPTFIGEDAGSYSLGSAIVNDGTMTISGEPVITDAGEGHLGVESPITLNTQPTAGTWKVYSYSTGSNDFVFAIPGADINLDASKFESLVEGYEVKKLDDGSLALVATATTE